MLKLMVVDDEMLIRKGLVDIVDWKDMGIEVTAQASNGRDALEAALREHPDIVITDIEMPMINGLEFSRQLLQRYPETRIIILTGYQNFSYMKEAIKFGAVEYLLKPIQVEELNNLMRRLSREILDEKALKFQFKNTKHMLAQNMPMMRGMAFQNFLAGRITEEEFLRKARDLGIPVVGPWYNVLAFEIDDRGEQDCSKDARFPKQFSVLNIAEEILGGYGPFCCGYLQNGTNLLGIFNSDTPRTDALLNGGAQIQTVLQQNFGFSVTIAVGKFADTVTGLRASGIEAEDALRYKLFVGRNQLIQAENIRICSDSNGIPLQNTDVLYLDQAVSAGNPELVRQKLNEIFLKYFSGKFYSHSAVLQFSITLLNPAIHALQDEKMTLAEVFGNDFCMIDELDRRGTLGQIQEFLNDVYCGILCALQKHSDSSYSYAVQRGIHYIEKHYAEKIQVSDIAEFVYLTPNYFSKIFKQETGENLTEWINQYRIARAKEIIRDQPEEKNYMVASRVGFLDYKYFAFIFKKVTGMTPGMYKEKCQSKGEMV